MASEADVYSHLTDLAFAWFRSRHLPTHHNADSLSTMSRHASSLSMPFLYTFSGMLIALVIWAALIVSGGADQDSVPTLLAAWLFPDSVTGWIFYGVLCVPCSWLMYRLLRLWFHGAG